SCTHNHNGPDTLGLWGPNPFTSGVDPDYLRRVEAATVRAIRAAEASLRPVTAHIGTVSAPELLHDSRPPIVKHDELVVLQFRDPAGGKPAGLVVQWNCHPETLDGKGTRISSDYVGTLVESLRAKHGCPVVYLTGTVGGLITTNRLGGPDEQGNRLPEGSVEKMHRYGHLLAARADQALAATKPLRMTPFAARTRSLALPMDNRIYLVGKQLGVLTREMERWTGDPYQPPTPLK